MKRREKITFAPQSVSGAPNRLPRYFWYTVIGAVAVGLISCFVILAINDFNISTALGKRADSVTCEETSAADENNEKISLEDMTDAVNFLAICGTGGEVSFCTVVSVVPSDALIRIKPISPDCVLEYDGGTAELSEIYRTGDITAVIKGLKSKAIPIFKYVSLSDDNFIGLMQKLGVVEVVLDAPCEFSVDAIRYTFPEGVASMNAEAVHSYMMLPSVADESLKRQAQIASAIIKTHFTSENVEKGDDFFSELINLVDTDITVFDYTHAVSIIRAMTEKGIEISVIS